MHMLMHGVTTLHGCYLSLPSAAHGLATLLSLSPASPLSPVVHVRSLKACPSSSALNSAADCCYRHCAAFPSPASPPPSDHPTHTNTRPNPTSPLNHSSYFQASACDSGAEVSLSETPLSPSELQLTPTRKCCMSGRRATTAPRQGNLSQRVLRSSGLTHATAPDFTPTSLPHSRACRTSLGLVWFLRAYLRSLGRRVLSMNKMCDCMPAAAAVDTMHDLLLCCRLSMRPNLRASASGGRSFVSGDGVSDRRPRRWTCRSRRCRPPPPRCPSPPTSLSLLS